MAAETPEIDLSHSVVKIEEEMKRSYLDYAMSVIVGRALPDVRDGLKPVHRRVLFAMYELGNASGKAYKKSARIVGDVIGKYHPHGDAAVYDALVRMAQDFSLRYTLVDGQGNFGSLDGDPAAAMRYTEVRMSPLGEKLLEDIEKETVDFIPNYDGTLQEPTVLPAPFPNLLVNGSAGIAVGMATNIPPHNLREVAQATLELIENPEISTDELIKFIPGPDFPTGGLILGHDQIREAYSSGRGIIQVRARAMIEKKGGGEKESIVITEIPFQVNKAKLLEEIAELTRSKRVEGISEIRDESDREGLRVVVDLKRGEIAGAILNHLFKHTSLQVSFGIINLAIVKGRPMVLSLKSILEQFLIHQREVVTRRSKFDLARAEERLHILEGFRIALDQLDLVIQIIRKSENPAAAKLALTQQLPLSEIQAQAILDLRLHRLTGMEREKIMAEHKETRALIAYLKKILSDEKLILKIVGDNLAQIAERYGDERRTEIIDAQQEIRIEDMITEEDMVITVSHLSYIKRNPVSIYRAQRRGGRGKAGMETREEDFVENLFVASTHDYLLFFTNQGRVHWLKVFEIPQAGRQAKGKPIVNLLELEPQEQITAYLPVREFREDHFVIMATAKGTIKKSELTQFSHPRRGGIIAITLEPKDELVSVDITNGQKEILLSTRMGKSIRFAEEEVRSIGRSGQGVRGISLEDDDAVVAMEIISPENPSETEATLLSVTENGYGKRTELSEYRLQSRAGKGIITIKTSARNGPVVKVIRITNEDEIMLITDHGKIIRLRAREINVIGRNTQGVRLIAHELGERLVGIARVAEPEEEVPAEETP
ncbi:MAG: DNA gyrase subunit A [Proteobacteria bacterium]|nr:DNA gyrase subunit A [Pseudomonadota bacterium]